MDAPPIDAPIVPVPPRPELLNENGGANDIAEYMGEVEWNVESFLGRRVVRRGNRYRFDIMIRWNNTWITQEMRDQLESEGHIVMEVLDERTTVINGRRLQEQLCSWPLQWQPASNVVSAHSRNLIRGQL